MCPFICYDSTWIASFHLLWNTTIVFLMWYNIFKRWTFPPVPDGVSASFWNPQSTLNLSRGIKGLCHFLSCLVVVLWVVSRAAFYQILEHLTLQSLRFAPQNRVPRPKAIKSLGSLLRMPTLRLFSQNTSTEPALYEDLQVIWKHIEVWKAVAH